MKLSTFIIDNIEVILQQWEDFASTIFPPNRKTSIKELRNHGKQILTSIAADLERAQSSREHTEEIKGFSAQDITKKSPAGEHGLIRMEQGFNINEVIAEFRALRKSVISLFSHSLDKIKVFEPNDLIYFNEAIDQELSEAVAIYAFAKEQQTRLFNGMLSSAPILSYVLDLHGKFIYVNEAMINLYQKPAHKIVGKALYNFEMPSTADMQEHIQTILDTGKQLRGQMSFKTRGGKIIFFEYVFAPIFDENGKIEAIAGMSRDITPQKLAETQIWRHANYDLLTGLPNRLMFREKLTQAIIHSKRSNKSLALLFIDLDQFKQVNDTLGHDIGDRLLKQVAARISACVRDTDTVARMGGDEFTVILVDICGTQQTILVVEKILSELKMPFQIKKHTVQITSSIGITLSPDDGIKFKELLRNADRAMYGAKKSGFNRFVFYNY